MSARKPAMPRPGNNLVRALKRGQPARHVHAVHPARPVLALPAGVPALSLFHAALSRGLLTRLSPEMAAQVDSRLGRDESQPLTQEELASVDALGVVTTLVLGQLFGNMTPAQAVTAGAVTKAIIDLPPGTGPDAALSEVRPEVASPIRKLAAMMLGAYAAKVGAVFHNHEDEAACGSDCPAVLAQAAHDSLNEPSS